MGSSRRALDAGGRFLDVGTGIAAISMRMCSIWPDLAWLPQPYLSAGQFQTALARVHAALRPDRWVVAPLGAAPEDAAPFDQAAIAHFVRLLGGDPIEVPDAVDLVSRAGFVDVTTWGSDQIILGARKPSGDSQA